MLKWFLYSKKYDFSKISEHEIEKITFWYSNTNCHVKEKDRRKSLVYLFVHYLLSIFQFVHVFVIFGLISSIELKSRMKATQYERFLLLCYRYTWILTHSSWTRQAWPRSEHIYIYIIIIICIYIYIYISLYIYIYIYIYISSSSSSRAMSTDIPDTLSPLLLIVHCFRQGYIPYRHRAAVCWFALVVLPLLGHVKGSTGVYHLWARPYFSSSVLHVWFV